MQVNKKGVVMKKILFTFIFIFYNSVVFSATTVQLESVLQKYGVPKASDCGTENEPHYNGVAPECQEWGMFYDKPNRRCTYCELGYVTINKTDTECTEILCQPGYGGQIIKDGKCPPGFGIFHITSGNCPVGSRLWKFP